MDGTVLGSLLGFFASLLPELLGCLRDRFVGRTTGTNGQVTDGGTLSVDALDAPDDAPAIQADSPMSHVGMEMLRASVRPVLTYAFFATFVLIKFVVLGAALLFDRTPAVALPAVVWDEGTETLFAASVSFWFGTRALTQRRR